MSSRRVMNLSVPLKDTATQRYSASPWPVLCGRVYDEEGKDIVLAWKHGEVALACDNRNDDEMDGQG